MLFNSPFVTFCAALLSVALVLYGIYEMVCVARAIYHSWKAEEYDDRLRAVTHPTGS
jgi:hypothetical protein